jgi:ribosomal protein S6
MKNYDLSVFFDIGNGEDEAKKLDEKLISVITNAGGKVYKHENLGKVSLMGTFKKHSQAYGSRIQYSTNNDGLAALNKEFQINEGIIRSLNTRLESVIDKKEMAELIG